MNKYVFKSYNPIFSQLFKKEKNRLSLHLTKKYSIEHMGSTAIKNLGGKGIIDIMVSTNKSDLSKISNEIQKAGYEYREVASTPMRLFFRIDLKDPLDKKRRYHLHLVMKDSRDWKEVLEFRNYLRNNPGEVNRYNALKKRAVKKANQKGEVYKKIKEPFIKKVLKNCVKHL